jgi:hypothetical protein
MKYVEAVVTALRDNNAYRATKYVSLTEVVRATRRRYHGKDGKLHVLKRENFEVSLTVGRPNFRERNYIKWCVVGKEPFPIKKIHLLGVGTM